MNAKIKEYLINELGNDEIVAEHLLNKVSKYDDIKAAFISWLETRKYDNTLNILGYTPAKISTLNPDFSGIGVYNFMVTLRDNPDYAKQRIAENFRTR